MVDVLGPFTVYFLATDHIFYLLHVGVYHIQVQVLAFFLKRNFMRKHLFSIPYQPFEKQTLN